MRQCHGPGIEPHHHGEPDPSSALHHSAERRDDRPPVAAAPDVCRRKGRHVLEHLPRFGVTVEELLAANPSLKNPNKISVGDGIVIPTPSAGSTETPTPDVTPEPTPAPTPEPTPIPPIADHPGPLHVDGFAVVLVTDLAIRSKPSVATDSKVLGRLTTGDRVFILKGPVEAGFAWYQVAHRDWESGEKPVGWIAAGVVGTANRGSKVVHSIARHCRSRLAPSPR